MNTLRKTALINIIFRYIQLGFSVVTGIVFIPLYLQYISSSDYGAWMACASVISWLSVFDPGIANIIIQKVGAAVGAEDSTKINNYINAGFISTLIIAIIIVAGGCLGAKYCVRLLGFSNNARLLIPSLQIASVTVAIMVVTYTVMGINYGMQSSWGAGLSYLLGSFSQICVTLLLLHSGYGILAFPCGTLTSATFLLICSGVILFNHLRKAKIIYSFSLESMKELLLLFFVSFGARMSRVLSRSMDNVIIARVLGPEFVSCYSLTATVPRQLENIIGQPMGALRPTISKLVGKESIDATRILVYRLLRIVVWIGGLLVSGLIALNDDFVRLWVGEDFFGGDILNYWLCAAFAMGVWTNTTGTIGFSLGDIKKNNKFEWVSSTLMIPVVLFGIWMYGLAGAVAGHFFVLLSTTAWYFPVSIVRRLGTDIQIMRSIIGTLFESVLSALVVSLLFCQVTPVSWPNFLVFVSLLVFTYLMLLLIVSRALREECATFVGVLISQI